MKNRNQLAGATRAAGKIVMLLAFAAIIVGMFMTPVLARDDDGRREGDRRPERHRHYSHEGHYRPRAYPAPGYYAPPPPPPAVYTPPPPPPGITFVFPIHIR